MYSNEEIRLILNQFKISLNPSIACLEDIKEHPNSILMSDYLADKNISIDQLAGEMLDFKRLEKTLGNYSSGFEAKEILPPRSSIGYHDGAGMLGSYLGVKTGKFSMGIGQGTTLSDIEPSSMTLPSGVSISFNRMMNEICINTPITFGGCCFSADLGIYVRDNFVKFLAAYSKAVQEIPGFKSYGGCADSMNDATTAIIAAHELGEREIMEKGLKFENPLDRELIAEKKAYEFLRENGFDMRYYELYHLLRQDKKRENESAVIVKNNFKFDA